MWYMDSASSQSFVPKHVFLSYSFCQLLWLNSRMNFSFSKQQVQISERLASCSLIDFKQIANTLACVQMVSTIVCSLHNN